MSTTVISASIVGGIGDIIFGLEGFKEIKTNVCGDGVNTQCYICTHAEDSIALVKMNPYIDFVKTIQFNNNLSHFKEIDEKTKNDIGYIGDAKSFCYTQNPEIYLSDKIIRKAKQVKRKMLNNDNKPLVIIHPMGSAFSRFFLGSVRNVSTKEMDVQIWQKIIQSIWKLTDATIVLIGSANDYGHLSAIKGNYTPIRILAGDLSIPEAIALVQESDLVVGADSFAKSVSLARQIPTVVLVNDHEDRLRDEVFLDPYKSSSYAKIIHSANVIPSQDLMYQISNFVQGVLCDI